jgi:hypothetical protein
MRQTLIICSFAMVTCVCRADDPPTNAPSPVAAAPANTRVASGAATAGATPASAPASVPAPALVPEPAWSPHPRRPPAIAPTDLAAATPQAATADDHPVLFTSEAKWDLAGYNNDEVIYTIVITSLDSRIIRCTTLLNGFFYENGAKHTVSDRQSTTVFPQQRAQAGNWQGMDKQSGTTYSVKCHPV